ncbi:MAG: hypothetical protein IPH06_04415 [Alphaproteobacteria bacterium]|nr:hypothetical protein [Alphaproteobacteria bacterium]QQS57277.1 MAG: hypothetical protein IPN28_00175 [Alphaproteobacteria bacterium]
MAEKPPSGKNPGKHGAPFSLRLTQEERKALDALADGMPLGAWIKDALINRDIRPRTRGRKPVKDREALAKLLGLLGQSRLSQNINQLAKAVHTGSLPVNADVHKALLEACAGIRAMRDALLSALGLLPSGDKGKDGGP